MSGTPVAVKVLVCQLLSPDVVEEFRGEIAVLSALRHPNVVLFMGAVTVAPNYCIITELVSRGSLWGVLHSSTPCVVFAMNYVTTKITNRARTSRRLDWPTCLKMAVDVCRGMAFLHSAVPSILHRDLKACVMLCRLYCFPVEYPSSPCTAEWELARG